MVLMWKIEFLLFLLIYSTIDIVVGLVVVGQDDVGIVAKLSDCIASRGGNIQSVDVFVPENKDVFYCRRSVPLFCFALFHPYFFLCI